MSLPSEHEFRAPPTAWVAAIGSFVFVGLGLTVVVVIGAHQIFPVAERGVVIGVAVLLSLVLGGVSARQAFLSSRAGAYQKLLEDQLPEEARPRSHALACFLGMIGGSLPLGLIMFFNVQPPERGYWVFAGVVGGATFGGLLLRAFVAGERRAVPRISSCGACGEQVVGLVPDCPVCGASLRENDAP